MESETLVISGEKIPSIVNQTIELIESNDPYSKIQAAKEIRRLTKTSLKYRRHFACTIDPLVSMLKSDSLESNEFALLALLNLAVKDEKVCSMHTPHVSSSKPLHSMQKKTKHALGNLAYT
ncbi:hypothetical protein FRX31_011157 [Thalictrum thalictroides]|uniref:Uncharacterized protein n=1 Tax=Thalictrum thalictroides TaxID=46969 RepID=A0A7J6WS19_THATH|nr:hypothetical protein FRX31_011157 [Thalictrum thalictroides]